MLSVAIRILYIDDDETLLEIGREFLGFSKDLVVDTSLKVSDAEVGLLQRTYDAIISDYQMPEMNGIDFLKKLRSQGNQIPFILFTGKSREEVVIEALNSGADFYLQKGGDAKAQFMELEHKVKTAVKRRRSEKEIIDSNDKLNTAMEMASLGFWTYDLQNKILTVDDHIWAILGTNKETEHGYEIPYEKYCREFVRPDDRDPLLGLIQMQVEANFPNNFAQYEHSIVRRDGQVRQILVRLEVIRDASGKVTKTYGVNQDITERKMAEERLAEREREFRAFVEQSTEGVSLMDHDGRLTEWNRSMAKITGIDDDEAIGQYFWDLSWSLMTDEVKANMTLESFRARIQDMLHTGQAPFLNSSMVSRIKRQDGQTRTIDQTIFPVTVGSNHRYGSIVRDVTDAQERERLLKENEAKFRDIFNSTNDAIFVINLQGRFLEVNEAACLQLGYSREELLQRGPMSIIHLEVSAHVQERINKTLERGSLVFESVHLTKEGREIPIEISTRVIDYKGNPAILGVERDITERKRSEMEREVLYSIGEIVNTDASFDEILWTIHDNIKKLMYAENCYIALYDADTATLSFPFFVDKIDPIPVSRAGWKGLSEYVIRSGRPLLLTPERLDALVREHEIETIGTLPESWLGVPLSIHSKTIGALVVQSYEPGKKYTDIEKDLLAAIGNQAARVIERKRMEEALREGEERFHEIFNYANDAIHVHEWTEPGVPGRFIDVNEVACRMLGYAREELFRMHPLDISTGYHDPPIEAVLESLKTTGRARFETEHRRKDGTIVPVEINSHLVNEHGKMKIVAVVRDISENKRNTNALQIANKKLNLLSSITRHDINNQLMALRGNLTLFETKHPEIARDLLLKKVEGGAERISAMIRFTKAYEDIGVRAPIWHNVRELVEHEAEGVALVPINLVNEIPSNVEVLADPLIAKVFHNLIDNAIKHGGKIANIHFHIEAQNNIKTIVCQDDGVGISPDMRGKLFTKGIGKDQGFGLFLSREILAITGITITEEGEPGKGAKFVITIPPEGMREST